MFYYLILTFILLVRVLVRPHITGQPNEGCFCYVKNCQTYLNKVYLIIIIEKILNQ